MKILILMMFSGMMVSCVYYQPRNILEDAMPDFSQSEYKSQHNFQIEVAPIIDHRPLEETEKPDQTRFRYFIPLLIWWQLRTNGPLYGYPEYYDKDLTSNLRTLINNVIVNSKLFSGNGKRYILQTELLHYYSVSYFSQEIIIAYSAAVGMNASLFPTGYVGLKLSLIDPDNSEVVATKYISQNFLFNANHPMIYPKDSPVNKGSGVAAIALKNLMYKIPRTLEQMLVEVHPKSILQETFKSFSIIRLTREYDFAEKVDVEYSTGRIIRSQIIPRDFPIFSRPNEWVVAPFSSDNSWLNYHQYKEKITLLQQKYNVSFEDNLNAAQFYGIKNAESSQIFHNKNSTSHFQHKTNLEYPFSDREKIGSQSLKQKNNNPNTGSKSKSQKQQIPDKTTFGYEAENRRIQREQENLQWLNDKDGLELSK